MFVCHLNHGKPLYKVYFASICDIVLSNQFLPKRKLHVLPFIIANNMLSYIAFGNYFSDKGFTCLIEAWTQKALISGGKDQTSRQLNFNAVGIAENGFICWPAKYLQTGKHNSIKV